MRPAITIQIEDLKHLESFCQVLLTRLTAGDVIALNGELGAGKTTLVQSLCRLNDIQEPVTSPTFSIAHEYNGNPYNILHIDAYRIESQDDPKLITLDEAIVTGVTNKKLILVEWAIKLPSFAACWTWQIALKRQDDDRRLLSIQEWPQRWGDSVTMQEVFSTCTC